MVSRVSGGLGEPLREPEPDPSSSLPPPSSRFQSKRFSRPAAKVETALRFAAITAFAAADEPPSSSSSSTRRRCAAAADAWADGSEVEGAWAAGVGGGGPGGPGVDADTGVGGGGCGVRPRAAGAGAVGTEVAGRPV